MIRISGVILNSEKQLFIALRNIYGIGKVNSIYICKISNILPSMKVKNLKEHEISKLQKTVSEFETEGNLRTRARLNIKRLIDIKCYRGIRHKTNLPVRGQRTKTNAQTRKKHKKKIKKNEKKS